MKNLSLIMKAALFSIAMYYSPAVMAQDDPDFDPGDPDEPTEVPFDSGLPVLIGAALVYGARRAYTYHKAIE